jgi:hypothetical protein
MTLAIRYARLVTVLFAVLLAVSCGKKEEETDAANQESIKQAGLADPGDSLILEMAGVDSMTVFDVLAAQHDVKHLSSLKGAYVIRIDSIKNEGGYYWLYSVNGVMGEVACDKHVTKNGDVVRWHYRQTGSMQM